MSRSWKPLTKALVSSVSEMSFEIHGSNAQRGVWRGGEGSSGSVAVGQAVPPPEPLDEDDEDDEDDVGLLSPLEHPTHSTSATAPIRSNTPTP
jgi:hypothetical protein